MPRVVEGMFAEGEKPVDPREPLLAQTRDNKNELDELFAGMSENIQQPQQPAGFTTNLLPQLQQQSNLNQQDGWSEVWEQQKAKQLDETRTAWAQELWEQQKDELKVLEKHYDDVLSPKRPEAQGQQQDPAYPTWNGLGQAPEFYRQAETYQPEGGVRTDIQEETPLLANDVTQQQDIEERTDEALPTLTEEDAPEFEKKAEIIEAEGGIAQDENEFGTTNDALPTWNGPGSPPEFYKEATAYTPTGGEKAPVEDEEKLTFTEQVKEKAAELGESVKETAQEAGHKIEEWKDTAFEKTADTKDATTNVLANAAIHVKDAALAVGHVVADTFNKITHRTPEEKKLDKTEFDETDKAIVENKENIAPEVVARQEEFLDSDTNATLEFAEGADKGREIIAEGPQIQARDRASRRFC